MKPADPLILALNGGSSSIKFALFQVGAALERKLYGKIDRIGFDDTHLSFHNQNSPSQVTYDLLLSDHQSSVNFLLDWLEAQEGFELVRAIGHRVVHGIQHSKPELITPELLTELHGISPYVPEHLPSEIKLIETLQKRHPKLPQIACFDTSFHQTMPRIAKLLPIPRRFDAKGIQRYGFHGLSYAYLMEELLSLQDTAAQSGRVILAHLGNGASMVAVLDGKSIDTSMGFTPASGLVMSTRAGDMDPGLVAFMAQSEQMSVEQFSHMINHESGLLGVSEISSDMRDLITKENKDIRAAEAIALFCYQAKKCLGSFTAILGGLDTLVFTGGIGENTVRIREQICKGLGFLGLELDENKNAKHAAIISSAKSRVCVRIIHTDEDLMIARSVCRTLGFSALEKKD